MTRLQGLTEQAAAAVIVCAARMRVARIAVTRLRAQRHEEARERR